MPFPPGGAADLVARLLADKLTVSLGQQVVPEYRAGAGETVATAEMVSTALAATR